MILPTPFWTQRLLLRKKNYLEWPFKTLLLPHPQSIQAIARWSVQQLRSLRRCRCLGVPSLSDELSTLDNNTRLDKLRTNMHDIKQALKAPADSVVLACLVDGFLHKRGFSPLEGGPRKAWVQANINQLSQASGSSS